MTAYELARHLMACDPDADVSIYIPSRLMDSDGGEQGVEYRFDLDVKLGFASPCAPFPDRVALTPVDPCDE